MTNKKAKISLWKIISRLFGMILVGCIIAAAYSFSYEKPAASRGLLPDTAGCTYKGFKLYGKIKIVDAFPDIKVKIVESFPDLKVQVVDNWPDDCGKWKFVDSFPDLKIQFVESFPDIKIKFVENWPGKP